MANRIFGTDGVRGQANIYPMTVDIALKIGQAVAIALGSSSQTNKVLIGKDTRLSGYMIEAALVAGLTSMGKDVYLLGPIPTPAVSLLTRSMRADLGIMISASHNPYHDNGIKLFDNKGFKLSDEIEDAIEELLSKELSETVAKPSEIGKTYRLKESYGRYIEYIKTAVSSDYNFQGLKIVLDCANGAAYKIAPLIIYELGAEVITIGDTPNGTNINDKCGSTHIEILRLKVLESGADIGIAFDGDADRVIMVDENGNVIDGDDILAVIAVDLKKKNQLANNKVVGTVMANMGFENFLNENGIELIRAKVGDRYVLEEIKKHKANLGGEQSGHIIMYDYNPTGDGIFTAVEVLSILSCSGKRASEALKLFQPKPQVLKNIIFSGNENPLDNNDVKDFVNQIQQDYNNQIRILLRKSGTEKLIRVMVEGDSQELINELSDKIIKKIQDILVI